MRHSRLPSIHIIAATFVIAGVLAPVSVLAQGQPPGQAVPVPPGPYKPVAIKMPAALNDPTFDAFRKELAQVADKKDRAALAKLVAPHFFWIPE